MKKLTFQDGDELRWLRFINNGDDSGKIEDIYITINCVRTKLDFRYEVENSALSKNIGWSGNKQNKTNVNDLPIRVFDIKDLVKENSDKCVSCTNNNDCYNKGFSIYKCENNKCMGEQEYTRYNLVNKFINQTYYENVQDGTKEEDGTKEVEDGTKEILDGTKEVEDGTKETLDGTKEVEDGTKQVLDGTKQVADGTKQVFAGTKLVADGTKRVVMVQDIKTKPCFAKQGML